MTRRYVAVESHYDCKQNAKAALRRGPRAVNCCHNLPRIAVLTAAVKPTGWKFTQCEGNSGAVAAW